MNEPLAKANILGVGIATVDIINTVADFPAEDSETRALSQRVTRGGNATNTLVVLTQLGHRCWWAGTIAEEPDTHVILNDLARYGVVTRYCRSFPQGKVPTSYVMLNQRNASRTIVHYRQLPEYDFESFSSIPLSMFDWIHFEARNIADTRSMLEHVRSHAPHIGVSLEVEKPRENIDALFAFPDVLIFSQAFARSRGATHAAEFLKQLRLQYDLQADLYCSWGSDGADVISRKNEHIHSPAVHPAEVVDTLGAGDTFNAAVIDGHLRRFDIGQTLRHACHIAGKKCGKLGLDLDL